MKSSALGRSTHIVLVPLKGLDKATKEAFALFCKKHPLVTDLYQTVGNWDFEVHLEVRDVNEFVDFRHSLYQQFPSQLGVIKVLNLLKTENRAIAFGADVAEERSLKVA